eukprot:1913237-Pleurochrysis_carterae.AAC.8
MLVMPSATPTIRYTEITVVGYENMRAMNSNWVQVSTFALYWVLVLVIRCPTQRAAQHTKVQLQIPRSARRCRQLTALLSLPSAACRMSGMPRLEGGALDLRAARDAAKMELMRALRQDEETPLAATAIVLDPALSGPLGLIAEV